MNSELAEAMQNKALENVVDSLNNRTQADGISVPWPPKISGKWACIARMQDTDRAGDNCSIIEPKFGYGYGIDKRFTAARNKAIRMAAANLGGVDTHHAQWRCVGPKGQSMSP